MNKQLTEENTYQRSGVIINFNDADISDDISLSRSQAEIKNDNSLSTTTSISNLNHGNVTADEDHVLIEPIYKS